MVAILIAATPAKAAEPSLLFTPSSLNASVGSEVVATIILNTAGQDVSGAGIKLVFDPTYLHAVRIEPSDIFTDYPATIIDNENGAITVSGIISSPTDLFTGEGTFADIVFSPLQVGATKVSYIFTPGSTIDSNIAVMTGNGDILAAVNQLTLSISESSDGATVETPTPTPLALVILGSQDTIIKKIVNVLGLSKLVDQYASARAGRNAVAVDVTDPLAPIVRQDPITDPSTIQPAASTTNVAKSTTSSTITIIILLFIVILLIGVIAWFVISRRQ